MIFKPKLKRILLNENEEGQIISEENTIIYGDVEYYLDYLKSGHKYSKGPHSSIFRLIDNDGNEWAIKICNYYKPAPHAKASIIRRYGRFINEINALNTARENDFQNIVEIFWDDCVEIDGKQFPYFVMEKGDCDLLEYFLKNTDIDIQEKLKLCIEIFNAIKELHSIGLYHRDIKPDNVFLFIQDDNFTWKIGDLGLSQWRGKDNDAIGERIGPYGWVSPEAMNKFLTEKYNLGLDCSIDSKSDIYQLGQLFWFIFQLNAPIGQIYNDDFDKEIIQKDIFFEIIKEMLCYSKVNRWSLETVGGFLKDYSFEYGL